MTRFRAFCLGAALLAVACDPTPIDAPPAPAEAPASTQRSALWDGTNYVTTTAAATSFTLAAAAAAAPIVYNTTDWPGVTRVLGHLRADIARVTGGSQPTLAMNTVPAGASQVVIVGTLGRSALIDGLVTAGKLDVTNVTGKWDTFVLQVVDAPMPGVDARAGDRRQRQARHDLRHLRSLRADRRVALVLVGRRAGAARRPTSTSPPAAIRRGEPEVKYRGIFINDEAPALSGWTRETVRRLQSPVLRAGVRAAPAHEGQLPVAGDVGQRVQRRRPAEPAPRRRIRRRHGHVAPRADDARAGGMAAATATPARSGTTSATTRPPCAVLAAAASRRMGNAREHRHGRHARRRRRADDAGERHRAARAAIVARPAEDHRRGDRQARGADAAAVGALQGSAGLLRPGACTSPTTSRCCSPTTTGATSGGCRTRATAARAGGYGVYYHFDYVGGPRNYKWINTNPDRARSGSRCTSSYETGAGPHLDRQRRRHQADGVPDRSSSWTTRGTPTRGRRRALPEYTRLWAEQPVRRDARGDDRRPR